MRKPGNNPERITHTSKSFPCDVWQNYAFPVWMNIKQLLLLYVYKLKFDINLLDEHPTFFKYYRRLSAISEGIKIKDAKNKIKNQFEKAVSILDKMFIDIDRDSELIDYARESINQTLRVEFSSGTERKERRPVFFIKIVRPFAPSPLQRLPHYNGLG